MSSEHEILAELREQGNIDSFEHFNNDLETPPNEAAKAENISPKDIDSIKRSLSVAKE